MGDEPIKFEEYVEKLEELLQHNDIEGLRDILNGILVQEVMES